MAFINTVTSVGDAALTESIITRSITELADDKITLLGKDALRGCRNLTKVDFPNLDSIGTSALQDCTKLESVILRKHLMCSLGANGLNGTPIANGTGYVYVPKTVIDVYKGSSSWSALVNQIRAYEDYAYMFSNLGKVWTQDSTTNSSALCYANGLWVTGRQYSTDGKTWTSMSGNSSAFWAVAYGNGMWVGGHAANTMSGYMYYSTDGKTWTKGKTSGGLRAVGYANGLWVANIASTQWWSEDGITWSQTDTTSFLGTRIKYANGVWVCGTTGGVYTSTDGKTWTHQEALGTSTVNGLSYVNGRWFVGRSSQPLGTSTDGVNWTALSTASSAYAVEYANGLYVAATYYGVYCSTDGTTWTRGNSSLSSNGLCYANGLWVATTSKGFWHSTDAVTWTQSNITTSLSSPNIQYADGVIVAATSNGLYHSEE